MSNPTKFDFNVNNQTPIYVGESFQLSISATVTGNPMDLTGYVGKAVIKKGINAIQPTLTFTIAPLDTTGVIVLQATTAETAALETNVPYYYDLIVTNLNSTIPLMYGSVQTLPRISIV